MSGEKLRQWIGWSVMAFVGIVFVFIAGGSAGMAWRADEKADGNTVKIESHISVDDQRHNETMRRLDEIRDGQNRLQDTLDRKHP